MCSLENARQHTDSHCPFGWECENCGSDGQCELQAYLEEGE
jgi:hypothetical protein